MTDRSLLALEHITKRHSEGGVNTVALRDVSIAIEPGEFVAIVGPSGAGKSTLLNVLGLLEEASSGTYKIAGVDVSELKEHERDALRAKTFGFVFQSAYILGEESVARNAALALDTQNVSRAHQVSVVRTILRSLGLVNSAEKRAKYLSGGERQRLAIGRAISTDPLVVLADEPTGNLDRTNSKRVLDILSELNSSGVTVLLITHDESVAAVAERTIRIVDGQVVKDTRRNESPRDDKQVPSRTGVGKTTGRAAPRVFADALVSITGHTARSAFLLLAFLLGAGGLVCAIGLSQSAAAQVSTRLSEEALNRVNVHLPDSWTEEQRGEARRQVLALPGVERVAERLSITSSVANVSLAPPNSFPRQPIFDGTVVGGGSDLLDLEQLSVTPRQAGQLLDGKYPAAVLGNKAATELGIQVLEPGVQIWVHGARIPVVGIISGGSGQQQFGNSILISWKFAAKALPGIRTLEVMTAAGYPPAVADAIPFAVSPSQPASVSIETVADLRHLARGVNADFAVFIGAMSVAVLVLASFSAATTLYLNVMGRSPEIALRRAVGASRQRIAAMFLVEGGLLGVAGGAAGCALGSLVVVCFCLINGWTPELSIVLIGVAIGTGLATGLVAAIIPAVRAARIDPAQAIRG